MLQCARGFARVQDGELEEVGDPFGFDEVRGGEEGGHVHGGERVGGHEVMRDVGV